MTVFLFALLGAVVGSFVGVVAERLHTGQSFLKGRSRCNSCARELEPFDLIPVVSALLSFSRCRSCKARIPVLYTVVELILGFLFASAYLTLGASLALLLFLPFLALLALVVVYDLRHTVVPLEGSIPLVLVALAFAWTSASNPFAFGSALLTAGIIALAFVALHAFSNGRAMGLGDAPISFALALITAPHALAGLAFSFWIGALFGIGVLVLRRGGPKMGIEVPFVPFLAAGFLLAYFTGWNPFLLL